MLDAPRFVKRFLRPLAARSRDVRRIRVVAQSDHDRRQARHSADPGQRPACRSARSAAGGCAPGIHRRAAARFDLCLAQSAAHAGRYRDLGAPRIATTGNLKLDVPEPPADADSLAALAGGDRRAHGASPRPRPMPARRRCCSRRIGDCANRSRSSSPSSRRAIRSAARASRRSRSAAGLTAVLRSRGELPGRDDRHLCRRHAGRAWADLPAGADRVHRRLAGASHGGQNPIEPIKLGAAILHGPHVWNFAEIYAALDEARGAEQVTDVGKLAVRIGAGSPMPAERAARRGRRARDRRDARRRARAHARRDRALSDADPPRAPRAAMREPAFWWREPGIAAARARARSQRSTARVAGRRRMAAGAPRRRAGDLRRQSDGRRRGQDADRACGRAGC